MAQSTVAALAAVTNELNMSIGDLIDVCGWWDWFCKDTALKRRTTKFIGLAKRINNKWGNVGIFLKNNCPINGPTYDSIILQDSNGDNHYFISKEDGVWNVYAVKSENSTEPVFQAPHVVKLAKWLNDQELPK